MDFNKLKQELKDKFEEMMQTVYKYSPEYTGDVKKVYARVQRFPEYSVLQDGEQYITLPTGAVEVNGVQVLENSGHVRSVYLNDCVVQNNVLRIKEKAHVKTGDKIVGCYYY